MTRPRISNTRLGNPRFPSSGRRRRWGIDPDSNNRLVAPAGTSYADSVRNQVSLEPPMCAVHAPMSGCSSETQALDGAAFVVVETNSFG